MNKDQIKGSATDIAGKVQEGAGKLVRSKEQQVKGLKKQIEGKAEKKLGDAKETIKKSTVRSRSASNFLYPENDTLVEIGESYDEHE